MNFLPLGIMFAVVGTALGALMIVNPALIIKIHIKSTERSNWRTEPISMEKELKNTKFRGINLIAVCLFAFLYIKFFIN
ncbi:MAG TPA: hypothetical protein PL125_04160 [Candidatus Omnitrophota bacterium]|nr:hypothetical protein [Candidatus Omnitrophota bacterium]HPT39372.1 hypothetical protein [Candidatus Omnitrophota bacterium]